MCVEFVSLLMFSRCLVKSSNPDLFNCRLDNQKWCTLASNSNSNTLICFEFDKRSNRHREIATNKTLDELSRCLKVSINSPSARFDLGSIVNVDSLNMVITSELFSGQKSN